MEKARRALVIGNGGYGNAPLANPANDARSISNLLIEAKFRVAQYIDANQLQMVRARDEFVTSMSTDTPSIALFYFAGHGVQIDWRNYLIPVDTKIANQADVLKYGFELNYFLSQLSPFKNTIFIFILDSCRDNPFGANYQPASKGLSQFDAPSNSLIAYSTSPGHVAEDGVGTNGLYTEKLLTELSVRGVKIEDALKRVRLNVRLASKGAQIPWESTSLEEEVFLFENAKLIDSAESVERQLIAELDRWTTIKNSTKLADWVAYLRDFPGGRFSEIARFRIESLTELDRSGSIYVVNGAIPPIAAVAHSEDALLTLPGPSSQALIKLADQDTIETAKGVNAANPFSSGRYALGRKFSVNDVADYVVTDQSNGRNLNPYTMLVTDVEYETDRVWINDGYEVLDLMGNYKLAREGQQSWQTEGGFSDVPRQLVPAELYVGQAWKAVWKQQSRREEKDQLLFSMDVRVTAREFVTVPAGKYNAFRIEAMGDQDSMNRDGSKGFQSHRKQIIWVVPGVNFSIKEELTLSYFFSRIYQRRELRQLRQHAF
jgi:hypothetical protein